MTRRCTHALVASVLLATTGCTLHPETTPTEPESSTLLPVAERRLVAAARAATASAVGPGARLRDFETTNPLSFGCSEFSRVPPGSPWVSQYFYEVEPADLRKADAYAAGYTAYLQEHGWHRVASGDDMDTSFHRGPSSLTVRANTEAGILVLLMSTGCLLRR